MGGIPRMLSTLYEGIAFDALRSGQQLEKIARTFGVDWPHLLAQIISFCIVCALLYWFAYKPVLKMLEVRRQQISLGIANAEKIKAELDRTEAQRQEVMSKANAEANRIIEEAHAAAARVYERETHKAIAEAEQIMVRSRETAAQDYARMLTELKREVGHLVVRTTASVAGRILTTEDQRRLAEETVKELRA
jgi:F-type H+-transporting ATPase subunit b